MAEMERGGDEAGIREAEPDQNRNRQELKRDARMNRSPIPYSVSDEACAKIKNGGYAGRRPTD